MKHLTLLVATLMACCTVAVAQEKNDSKYLAGAVPEENGKVVFSKEFTVPGMSQTEIHERVKAWMEKRLAENGNNSRVVLSDTDKGQIVGTGEQWIVFSSSALSLDRTKIFYQLTAKCQPEKCVLRTERIRFVYREGKEKYSAEEWIVDKFALNKDKTKLVRGLAKWRRKTVDFADELFAGVASALGETKGNVVITNEPATSPAKVPQAYRAVKPEEIPTDAVQTGAGKLVIVIGEEPFNMTMMTADSGGSLGKVDGKPVVFSILSPNQPHEQMERAETYTVRFYPTGQTEPSLILECKSLPSPSAIEGMPRTYVGEILNAQVKQ